MLGYTGTSVRTDPAASPIHLAMALHWSDPGWSPEVAAL